MLLTQFIHDKLQVFQVSKKKRPFLRASTLPRRVLMLNITTSWYCCQKGVKHTSTSFKMVVCSKSGLFEPNTFTSFSVFSMISKPPHCNLKRVLLLAKSICSKFIHVHEVLIRSKLQEKVICHPFVKIITIPMEPQNPFYPVLDKSFTYQGNKCNKELIK